MSTDDKSLKTDQSTDPSVVAAGAVFRKKWIPVIVHRLLRHGPLGFSALCDRIDGMSSKVLSENLEEMEKRGLADAADVDRLDNCCISVPTPDGDLVPFCAYNMTTENGEYALRNRHGWGGRDEVGAGESGESVDSLSDGTTTLRLEDD